MLQLIIQHWNYYRHEEIYRLNMIGAHAIIVAALFTFIARAPDKDPRLPLAFLLGLSIMGLLMTLRSWANLGSIQERLERLAGEVGIPKSYVTVPSGGLHVAPRTRPRSRGQWLMDWSNLLAFQHLIPLIFLLSIGVNTWLVIYPQVITGSTSGTMVIKETRTLKNDYVGNIVIVENDVTLDCDDHIISGPGSGVGIKVAGYDGVTVRNCHVTNFGIGFRLYRSSKNTFEYNFATDNGIDAVQDSSSIGNKFIDNEFRTTKRILGQELPDLPLGLPHN